MSGTLTFQWHTFRGEGQNGEPDLSGGEITPQRFFTPIKGISSPIYKCILSGGRVTELEDGGVLLELTARSEPELLAWERSLGEAAALIQPMAKQENVGEV